MTEVVIYCTLACPFCVRAKQLLDRKGVSYTEHRVDLEPQLRPEMERRASGRTSVPQIFIDDYHVGGYDDLVALDLDGRLDPMLGLA